MPILAAASAFEVQQLLELFSQKALRENWPDIKLPKSELCAKVAAEGKPAHKEISRFIDAYFACCKQHIFVFDRNTRKTKIEIPDSQKIAEETAAKVTRVLFLLWSEYHVILREPLEEIKLRFLWPILFEFTEHHILARFVVLEKSMGARFKDRSPFARQKSTEEMNVLASLASSFGETLTATDLNKGIKQLWKDDYIDGFWAQFKKPISTATEAMDEERGIKKFDPKLYRYLLRVPLYHMRFTTMPKLSSTVSVFTADPTKGHVSFPRYTDEKEDADRLVREILRLNE